MSCVLTVLGQNLDVDSFVEVIGIQGFSKKYKGDIISVKRNKRLEHSLASLIISEAGFDNLSRQMKDAENFLRNNKTALKHIAVTSEIEFATIDFEIDSLIQKRQSYAKFVCRTFTDINLC